MSANIRWAAEPGRRRSEVKQLYSRQIHPSLARDGKLAANRAKKCTVAVAAIVRGFVLLRLSKLKVMAANKNTAKGMSGLLQQKWPWPSVK